MKLITIITFLLTSHVFAGAKFCYNHQSQILEIQTSIFYYNQLQWAPLIKQQIQSAWDAKPIKITINQKIYTVKIRSQHFALTTAAAKQKAALTNTPDQNFIQLTSHNMENSSFIDADFNGTINNVGSWLYQETKGQWIGYDFINLPLNIIPNQVPAHYLNSKTIPHEFGHILGLEHPNRGNLFEMGAPHIMAPRGMYVDSAYQIDPTIDPMAEPNHPGARMNQTLRVVTETNGIDLFSKIKDLAENNQSGCRYVGGIKKTLI